MTKWGCLNRWSKFKQKRPLRLWLQRSLQQRYAEGVGCGPTEATRQHTQILNRKFTFGTDVNGTEAKVDAFGDGDAALGQCCFDGNGEDARGARKHNQVIVDNLE